MNSDFSDRVGRVEPSVTLVISNLASELEVQGEDVADLSIDTPDFPTLDNIMQTAKNAPDAGHTSYTSSDGIPELEEAIAAKLRGNSVDAEANEVIATPGGKQALFEMFQTLVDDDDEVVLLDPVWVSYEVMVKLTGGTFSRADLTQHNFHLEPALDGLADTASGETKLLVVNSPSNPAGGVLSDAALEGVRDLAVEHDIAVISGEIYERIVYDGFEHTSLGSLGGMEDRTITINGFSRALSMTGWRLGHPHAPSDFIAQVGEFHSHSVSCAVNFVQHTGVKVLSERTDDGVEEMCQAFEDRRDMFVDLPAEHDVNAAVPKDALYMMFPVDGDDQAWYEGAIQDAKVVTVSGSTFNAPGYARTSYAVNEECLREAVERLVEHGYIRAARDGRLFSGWRTDFPADS